MTEPHRTAHRQTPLRRAAALAAVGLVAAVVGSPASAHVDTGAVQVRPGSRASVAFRITHGCSGSPTVRVAVRVPAGVTAVVPVPVPGWKASMRGRVVTWSGGRLAPDVTQRFAVTATFPAVATSLAFPMIQTCTVGSIAWTEPTVAGAPEPARPAPIVVVGSPGRGR